MVIFPDKTITAFLNQQVALHLYSRAINYKIEKKGPISYLVALGPFLPIRIDHLIDKVIGPFVWYKAKDFVTKKDRIIVLFNETEDLTLFENKELGVWWLIR
jgi:hypothetical protein